MITLELPGKTQVDRQQMALTLLSNPMYVEYINQEISQLMSAMVDTDDEAKGCGYKHQIRALRAFRDLVTKEATTKVENA